MEMKEEAKNDKGCFDVEELQQKIEELENSWKRARADYINLERRIKEQQAAFASFANEELIKKLLPVLDDLEKAVEVEKENKGLELIQKNMQNVLKTEGVEEIKVKADDSFDPKIMEGIVVEGAGETLKITEILRKGYRINGEVLRPIQVKVERL